MFDKITKLHKMEYNAALLVPAAYVRKPLQINRNMNIPCVDIVTVKQNDLFHTKFNHSLSIDCAQSVARIFPMQDITSYAI